MNVQHDMMLDQAINEARQTQQKLDRIRTDLTHLIRDNRQAARSVGDSKLRSAYRAFAQDLERILRDPSTD